MRGYELTSRSKVGRGASVGDELNRTSDAVIVAELMAEGWTVMLLRPRKKGHAILSCDPGVRL